MCQRHRRQVRERLLGWSCAWSHPLLLRAGVHALPVSVEALRNPWRRLALGMLLLAVGETLGRVVLGQEDLRERLLRGRVLAGGLVLGEGGRCDSERESQKEQS